MCHPVERKSEEEEPVSRGNRKTVNTREESRVVHRRGRYLYDVRIGRVDKVRKKDLKKEKLREFITRNQ